MIIVKNNIELKQALAKSSDDLAFVPTMGALHDGHLSLLKQARQDCKVVLCSIFVNPTQFLVGEDLDSYPRQTKKDLELCEKNGVDICFLPSVKDLYFDDEVLIKAPKNKSYILEGFCRPEHFDGVLQVVLKLFNLVKPKKAYFGQKDAQQLLLIRQMQRNLFLDIDIIACEIFRENDGLAMSSRNVYLDKKERQEALCLIKSLRLAKNLVKQGQRDILEIKRQMMFEFKNKDLEYLEILSYDLEYIEKVEPSNTIILLAVKFSKARLIDNIWL